MSFRKIPFFSLVVFFAACIYLPGQMYRLPHAFFASILVTVAVLAIGFPKVLVSSISFAFLGFITLIIFEFGNKLGFQYDAIMTSIFSYALIPLLSLLLLYAMLVSFDYRWFRLCSFVLLGLVVLSCVQTLRADADISRNLLTNIEDSVEARYVYENIKSGVSGYGLAHALPLLVAPLVFCSNAVREKFLKPVYFGMAVLVLLTLFHTGYGTSSGVAAASFPIALLILRNKRVSLAFMAIALIVGVAIYFSGIIPEVASFAKEFADPETVIYEKLNQVELHFTTVEGAGQWNVRVDKYDMAMEEFALHPFFGGDPERCGGHSFILTTLGTYGIVGLGTMLLMMHVAVTRVKKLLAPLPTLTYNIVLIALSAMLVVKSEALREQLCFVFLVIPAIMIALKEDWFYRASDITRRIFQISYYGSRR